MAVSLCCPGYPPASCCPRPLHPCCPHHCGPLHPGCHCRACGGHSRQLCSKPVEHCGAGLGDDSYLSCSHWHRLTPGCCGYLPARPPWSCLPPATIRPSCCSTRPPAHGGGVYPTGGHQGHSPCIPTPPCRYSPATAYPGCCPIHLPTY